MSRKKYELDLNALFVAKILLHVNVLKTWEDVANAYYEITKKEVPASYLSKYARNIVGSDISVNLVSEYLMSYTKEKGIKLDNSEKEIEPLKVKGETTFEYSFDDCEGSEVVIPDWEFDDVEEPQYKLSNGPKTIQQAMGITDEDKKEIFGVLDTDDDFTQKSKIMKKLADQDFTLEYLGYNKNMYYVEKIIPGSWTTPMKLKQDLGYDIPIIITNDKFSIVIKQNLNVQRDYERLAVQSTEIFKEMIKDIKFPNIVKRKNLGTYRDTLVTQHVCDLHMGSLINWTETSFDNWDSKKASFVQHKITDYTIEKQVNYWNSKTLYLVYNGDIVDIDNLFAKTSSMSNHTMQTDSRWNKIYSNQAAIILYNLVKLSPYFEEIVVKFNRGNHDKQTMDSLFMTIATSVLLSKFSNINVGYDRSEFLKESYFPWGKHLFLSDHGEKSDDVVLKNMETKFGDLMTLYPFTNIVLGHQHEWKVTPKAGGKIIFREPSLTPVTNYEADQTSLIGKGHPAQFFNVWKKENRYPNQSIFEVKSRSVWKDGESDPENIYPSTMEEVQEVFLTEGYMQPTYQQKELARFFETISEKVKQGLESKGLDTKDIGNKALIELALESGTEIPLHLRTTNSDFVINNMDKILEKKPKQLKRTKK